ncbi:MAG: ABC transporter ATP-binding protein [Pseudomonadota bacterium]
MTTPATAPIVEMEDIHHSYPGAHGSPPLRAVDGVALHVGANEVVCLLGPSGCGKSTLLRLAAGLERLQSGRILLGGVTVADPDAGIWTAPEHRHVGLVFQDSALFPHLSVLGNVTFGLDRLPRPERERRGREWLDRVHMAEYAQAYPHQLSGGQQQRVALARALAPEPTLMLMDEPFASLDAGLRNRVRDDTLHALKSSGAGTVLVTHDPQEALFMADRIALMRAGRLVQVGTPDELYCRPAEPFVVRFFGDVNEVAGRVRRGRVATPLGPVGARGLAEDTAVTVLIRPEALRVQRIFEAPAQGEHTHVVASRLLGSYSLLHLCVHDAEGGEQHFHAHAHGVVLPRPGQAVELALDASQVFVFPAASS